MIQVYGHKGRGTSKTDWLNSKHTFSFAEFRDPNRLGLRSLRVVNEDRVAPGAGFGEHAHTDMEILTYVISGALAHRDSLGNGSIIMPGEIQRMSAGTGIIHSEMNASNTDPVHFLQIWIVPDQRGYAPSYEQVQLKPDIGKSAFDPIASKSGGDGQVRLHQNASVAVARPIAGEQIEFGIDFARFGFLHIIDGQITVDGKSLRAGDGLAFAGGLDISLSAQTDAHILRFDLD